MADMLRFVTGWADSLIFLRIYQSYTLNVRKIPSLKLPLYFHYYKKYS